MKILKFLIIMLLLMGFSQLKSGEKNDEVKNKNEK